MKTTRIFNPNGISFKDIFLQILEPELDKIVYKNYNENIEDTAVHVERGGK